jgi:hypothetical protein
VVVQRDFDLDDDMRGVPLPVDGRLDVERLEHVAPFVEGQPVQIRARVVAPALQILKAELRLSPGPLPPEDGLLLGHGARLVPLQFDQLRADQGVGLAAHQPEVVDFVALLRAEPGTAPAAV